MKNCEMLAKWIKLDFYRNILFYAMLRKSHKNDKNINCEILSACVQYSQYSKYQRIPRIQSACEIVLTNLKNCKQK